MATSPNAGIEHGTSRSGRWLRERRLRVALWIAVIEGIVVAVASDISRWTVIALAVAAVALYALALRESRSDTLRQVGWILAASQLLALLVVIFAFVVEWLAILVVVLLAVAALIYLFSDRR